ncbi:MAG: GNAT family N-acetyltransferase [Pseudohongiella sp.]|nr:GNAT family N-acetyltransferase [Pseudohongiella sp.]MDO9520420.1 GNAT family N-acetyltransferase [Pseudohongiella sp.]MDP2126571.1 GNAT family N-acetyltransferase [Pseudohongiella sp.]
MRAGEDHRITFRKAEMEEMDWAYQLFKSGLQQYIAETWGWNELFQHHSFLANLPASSFIIASLCEEDIGGYCLKNKTDHLYLEMLLLTPQRQRKGLGTQIMQHVMLQAKLQGLPVHLSVLKNNPAHKFYRQLGFSVYAEDSFRYKMSSAVAKTKPV